MEFLYGRTVEVGQKVRVYVNLHQQGKFSIVNVKTGLVCGYAHSVLLENAEFHVSESGRLKVVEEQRKRVHAWLKGTLMGTDITRPEELASEVHYNPYLYEGFTDQHGIIITNTEKAYLINKRVYIK